MSERSHLHQIPCRDYPFFNYRYTFPQLFFFSAVMQRDQALKVFPSYAWNDILMDWVVLMLLPITLSKGFLSKGFMDFLKPALNTIYYNVEQFEF